MSIIKTKALPKEERLGQTNFNKQNQKMTIVEYKNYNSIIVQFNDNPKLRKNTTYRHFLDGEVAQNSDYRIGMSKINKQGCLMRIIEYNNASDIIVEFEDESHTKKSTTWSMFKKNSVNNPNLPRASTKPKHLRKSKPNSYELHKEYGTGFTSKGEEFYFDLEDFELIRKYRWHIDSCGYVTTGSSNNKIRMHKLILTNSLGLDYFKQNQLVCDHINRIKTDNRKSNLRATTQSINGNNKDVVDQGGVSYSNYHKKWLAYINFKNVHYHLGCFKTEQQARDKRDEALEQIRNGTFKPPVKKYSKDKFVYDGKEYNLTELCRLLNIDRDQARYQIYKKNKSLADVFKTEVTLKGDCNAQVL